MEDYDAIGLWYSYGIHVKQRSIYLENDRIDEVDPQEVAHTMTSRFIKSMQVLESINSEPITIIINTPGGDEYAGFAIYDRIAESPCKMIIRGYGHIMSMGTIIMQAGHIRQVSPESYFMIHDGSNCLWDQNPKAVENWSKHFNHISSRMYDIYLDAIHDKHPKMTRKKIETICKHDTIYTAQETVDMGLADEIYLGVR